MKLMLIISLFSILLLGINDLMSQTVDRSYSIEESGRLYSHNQDTLIQTLINQVNLDTLIHYVNILSGEDSVCINDSTYLILSRYTGHPHNDLAADFIEQTLINFGLSTFNQYYSSTGRNVYAVQVGSDYPDQEFIICAHYDDMPDSSSAPGADDNASGVASVLESARILSQIETPYTIVYALWDEEEQMGIGSEYYAQQAVNNNEKIVGVINLEMLGWDSDDDGLIDIHTKDINKSAVLAEFINDLNYVYDLGLLPFIFYPGSSSSDHSSFWRYGYTATVFGEAHWGGDFNDYYHTSNDKIVHFNLDYFYSLSKLAVASISYLSFYSLPVQTESNISLIGHYDKAVSIVKVQDNIAYVATYDSLEILDCSFPQSPIKIGGFEAPFVSDFILHGDYILMINSYGVDNFEITDVSNPASPAIISTIEDYCGESLSAQGNYVYSICSGGILGHKDIIDISVPSNPIWLLHKRGGGNHINVSDHKAYISYSDWYYGFFEIYDVSDPDTFQYLSYMNSQRTVSDISIKVDIAFLAGEINGLRIIDVSDSSSPHEIAYFNELGATNNVEVFGNYAYLANGNDGIRVVDISVPENPQGVGFLNLGSYIHSIATDNQYIYAATDSGLFILQNDLITSIKDKKYNSPKSFSLKQNYPNPFNLTTNIEFSIPKSEFVTLKVYNILGEKVATLVSEKLTSGKYKYVWDARGLASGVYLYRLQTGEYIETMKMILMR